MSRKRCPAGTKRKGHKCVSYIEGYYIYDFSGDYIEFQKDLGRAKDIAYDFGDYVVKDGRGRVVYDPRTMRR